MALDSPPGKRRLGRTGEDSRLRQGPRSWNGSFGHASRDGASDVRC